MLDDEERLMLSRGHPRTRQEGFTIVELVVTITVLALILLVAMPSIGNWLTNTRIRNMAESLQNGLQTARNEAVRRNQNIGFYLVSLTDPAKMDNSCALSDTGASWVIAATSPATKCASAPSTTTAPMIVSKQAAGSGAAGVKAKHDDDTTAHTVEFNGLGRVVNADTAIRTIEILGPDADASSTAFRPLQLHVTAAGAVRLCDPSTALPSNDPRRCPATE